MLLFGAGGQSLRLFQLLQGPDWNLLAYETHGKVIDARRGLRIHHIGEQDELIDTQGTSGSPIIWPRVNAC